MGNPRTQLGVFAITVASLELLACSGTDGGNGACRGITGRVPSCATDEKSEACNTCKYTTAEPVCATNVCKNYYNALLTCAQQNGCVGTNGIDTTCAQRGNCANLYTGYATCLSGCPAMLSCVGGNSTCNLCGLESVLGKTWWKGTCDTGGTSACAYLIYTFQSDGAVLHTGIVSKKYIDLTNPWKEMDLIISASSYRGTWKTDCNYLETSLCGGTLGSKGYYRGETDRWYWLSPSTPGAGSAEDVMKPFDATIPVAPTGWDGKCSG